MRKSEEGKWFSSIEARKSLKISDCDLAHLRNEGKLIFKKRGNAFLYFSESLSSFVKKAKDHYR